MELMEALDEYGQPTAAKVSSMETERFFAERRNRADDAAFRRILNRKGGEPPRPEDEWSAGDTHA